jgi:tetratricopeptide (TPR) repeat protein
LREGPEKSAQDFELICTNTLIGLNEKRRSEQNGGMASRYLAAAICVVVAGCVAISTDEQINYGLNHYDMGLYNRAIPPLMSAAESLEGKNPPDPRLVDVLIALGVMAQGTGRGDLAGDFYPRALRVAEMLKPADSVRLRNSLVHLGTFYIDDRPSDAVVLLERAEKLSGTIDDQVIHAIDLDNLAQAHQSLKQYPQAIALSTEALRVVEQHPQQRYAARTKGVILHSLAMSYSDTGDVTQAETLFNQSLLVLRSAPDEVEAWRLKAVTTHYAQLLRRTGRALQADELERQIEGQK